MKLKTLDGKIFLGSEVVKYIYIYQLTYEDEGSLLMIGYFGSWKKARSVMKKYRSTLPGFKEYPNCFIIKKMKVNKDNYYFL